MTDNQSDVVPLAIAAERLALSTEAVRKRIQRGTLPGHKVNGTWFVDVSALPSRRLDEPPIHPDDGDGTAGQSDADGRTHARTPVGAGVVDLQPLVDVIERLHGENQRLTEAATAWQFRARAAEERLAALEAGPQPSDAEHGPQDAKTGPLRDETVDRASESLSDASWPPNPASDRLALRWRAWWRRVMGG